MFETRGSSASSVTTGKSGIPSDLAIIVKVQGPGLFGSKLRPIALGSKFAPPRIPVVRCSSTHFPL